MINIYQILVLPKILISFILFIFYIPTISSSVISNRSKVIISSDQPTFLQFIKQDYGFSSSSLNTTFLNAKTKNVAFLEDTEGKLAYINSNESFTNLFKLNRLYNHRWYFYVDDLEFFDIVIKNQTDARYYMLGIIINENLVNQINKSHIDSEIIPIMSISNLNHTLMTEYDYNNQRYNTFFVFTYYREIKVYPTKYYFIITIISFVLCGGFLTAWSIKIKLLDRAHITSLQKILIVLPVAELLVNIAICLELNILNNPPSESSSSTSEVSYQIYFETTLITLNALFRTLLWFLIALIVYGWQITKQSLTREEKNFFIKIYMFMYIAMFIDQIINVSMSNSFILTPSEIKNLLFYLVMVSWLTKRGIKSYRFLKRKLVYAITLTREFIPALILKLKMVKASVIILYYYFVLYLVCLIIDKNIFSSYNKIELISYHILDLLLMIAFMSVYFPRVFPPNFSADLNDDNEDFDIGEIYQININKLDFINNKFIFDKETKKTLRTCVSHSYPILVCHPFPIDNETFSTKSNFINKIFENSNVGKIKEE